MLSPRERLDILTLLTAKVATVTGHVDMARQLLAIACKHAVCPPVVMQALSHLDSASEVTRGIDCSVFFDLAGQGSGEAPTPIKLFGGPYDGLLIQHYSADKPATVLIGMQAAGQGDASSPGAELYVRHGANPSLFGHLPGFNTTGDI